MKQIILVLLMTVSTSAFATIYVKQNPSGGTEYTDTPSPAANQIDIPPANSISTAKPATQPAATTTPVKTSDNDDTQATSNANTYTTFEILSPANETTFQNQPVIPIELKIEPNVLPGDKIQIMLDGQAVGTPTAAPYQEIPNVARGSHSVYAVMINNKGETIKRTSAVTIYVHRASVADKSPSRVNRISQLLRS